MTWQVFLELLEAMPETLCNLDLIIPFASLPESLPSYNHLIHLRCLSLADSIYLETLPGEHACNLYCIS